MGESIYAMLERRGFRTSDEFRFSGNESSQRWFDGDQVVELKPSGNFYERHREDPTAWRQIHPTRESHPWLFKVDVEAKSRELAKAKATGRSWFAANGLPDIPDGDNAIPRFDGPGGPVLQSAEVKRPPCPLCGEPAYIGLNEVECHSCNGEGIVEPEVEVGIWVDCRNDEWIHQACIDGGPDFVHPVREEAIRMARKDWWKTRLGK